MPTIDESYQSIPATARMRSEKIGGNLKNCFQVSTWKQLLIYGKGYNSTIQQPPPFVK